MFETASELDLFVGAGDGNRTRTVSLGIGQIMACDAADQPTRQARTTRD